MAMPMPQQSQGQGQQPAPQEIEAKLLELLQQAAQLARQHGIDFNALVAKVSGGGAPVPPPMP